MARRSEPIYLVSKSFDDLLLRSLLVLVVVCIGVLVVKNAGQGLGLWR